jgi:hypothetical protein
MVNRSRRHLEEVFQERSQKAHRAELERNAKASVIPSPPRDALAIRVIEMERPGELLTGRVTGIAAIARLLVLGYTGDRHGGPVRIKGFAELLPSAPPHPPLAILTCGLCNNPSHTSCSVRDLLRNRKTDGGEPA